MRAVSAPMPSPMHISPIMKKFWQHQQAARIGREMGHVTQMSKRKRKLEHD